MKKKEKEPNPLHHLKKGDVIYRVWRPKKGSLTFDWSRDEFDSDPYEATPFTVVSFGHKHVQLSCPYSESMFNRKLSRESWDSTHSCLFFSSKEQADKEVHFRNAMVNLDGAAHFILGDMVKSVFEPEELLELSEAIAPLVRKAMQKQAKKIQKQQARK